MWTPPHPSIPGLASLEVSSLITQGTMGYLALTPSDVLPTLCNCRRPRHPHQHVPLCPSIYLSSSGWGRETGLTSFLSPLPPPRVLFS